MASAWRAAFQSHDGAGVLYINTFGVKMDPVSGDGLNATDLASAVYDWFGAEYRACLPGVLTLDSVTVDSFPAGGIQGVHAVGLAGLGSPDTDLPGEVCSIFAWKTDVATKSGRGHIAFPMPRDTALTTGSVINGGTAWRGLVDDLFAALDDGHDWGGPPAEGHLSHVVLSKKNGAYYDVKTRLVRNRIRWIERRQTAP